MAKQRKHSDNVHRVKRLDELKPEFATIISRLRGEPYDLLTYELSKDRVFESAYFAACAMLRPRYPAVVHDLATNAVLLWWEFLTKAGGGLPRYDGLRPIGAYVFASLRAISFSRKNLQTVMFGRETSRASNDLRRKPTRTSLNERREVQLGFDPVDPCSTRDAAEKKRHIEEVREKVTQLDDRQRCVLEMKYLAQWKIWPKYSDETAGRRGRFTER